MRQKVYATLAGAWDTLLVNSVEDLAALPHLTAAHQELTHAHARLVELNESVEAERARLQAVVEERRQLILNARRPRNAVVRTLLAAHGDDNQRLVRYGLNPRVPRARRTRKVNAPEATPTVETE